MLAVDELKRDFWEKLSLTGSLDDAFTKAVWNAYKKGIDDGRRDRPSAGQDRGEHCDSPCDDKDYAGSRGHGFLFKLWGEVNG